MSEFVSMLPSQFQVVLFGKHKKLMKRKRKITYVSLNKEELKKRNRAELQLSTTKTESPIKSILAVPGMDHCNCSRNMCER